MFTSIYKIRHILNRATKIRLLILIIAIIIGAFVEMLALAMIQPVIDILYSSSLENASGYIKFLYDFLGFSDIGSFLALLTFLLAAIYIFRGFYLFTLSRIQFRFIARRQALLSERLVQMLLGRSYIYHTKRNSAEIQRITNGDPMQAFDMINSVLFFLTDMFMMLFILIFLIIVSPIMTLMMFGLACLCVLIYFPYIPRANPHIGRTVQGGEHNQI
jgi:ABC-type multidrug transport system fused ATPase/permease subunit